MKTYICISERWSRDPVECTIEDLRQQAKNYTDQNDGCPVVTVEETHAGVVDNTGELIAISPEEYNEQQ